MRGGRSWLTGAEHEVQGETEHLESDTGWFGMKGRGVQCWLAMFPSLSWGGDSDLSWGAGDHGERGQTAEAAPQAPCDTAPASASGGHGQCHPPAEKHDQSQMYVDRDLKTEINIYHAFTVYE